MSLLRASAPSVVLTSLVSVLALAGAACSAAPPADVADAPVSEASASASAAFTTPGIDVVVTVDWEGRELAEENLRAMEQFRARYPQVRLVQFLNAAYFTKRGARAADVRRAIRRVVKPGDELGLHVHGWKR